MIGQHQGEKQEGAFPPFQGIGDVMPLTKKAMAEFEESDVSTAMGIGELPRKLMGMSVIH